MTELGALKSNLVNADLSISELNQQLFFDTNLWLERHFNSVCPDPSGIALIAVGGLGRSELTVGSDLDLLLLHGAKAAESSGKIAEKIWYPIWDSGVGLDHSVRTVDRTIEVAQLDLRVLFGLLDMRLIAGDHDLAMALNNKVLDLWRKTFLKKLPEIIEADQIRHETFGDLSHLQNPNLKESKGGLRDLVTLSAIAKSWQVEVGLIDLQEEKYNLLQARSALHLITNRSVDLLSQDYQPEVAKKLGFASSDELLSRIYASGRKISFYYQNAIRNGMHLTKKTSFFSSRLKTRRPVADGLVVADNQIQLAINHQPSHILLLRLALAAAEHNLVMNPNTLMLLRNSEPSFQWDDKKRELFIALLASGPGLIDTWEALDQSGVIELILPQWKPIRFAPQRNSVHQFTVDRHLIQTVVEASALTTSVARPDILLMAALLHDIGKGRLEDHSVLGAQLAAEITVDMGFSKLDREMIVLLVRHHLLLVDTATKRDLEDSSTVSQVTQFIKSQYMLNMLEQLTIADAKATSSIAASNWRLNLVSQLVNIVRKSLAGDHFESELKLVDQLELDKHGIGVSAQLREFDYQINTSVPDSPGLLAKISGLFAIHQILVRSAKTQTISGRAVSQWQVQPLYGEMPSIDFLRSELNRVITGNIDLEKILSERADSKLRTSKLTAPPRVIYPEVESEFTVIEVRAHDMPGLLYRIVNQISQQNLDIVAAIVSTMGATVDDIFYLRNPDGARLSLSQQEQLSQAILAELSIG